jgi:hypothetical protein
MNPRIVRPFTMAGLIALGLAVASPNARADLSVYSAMVGVPTGVNYVNFNDLTPGQHNGTSSGPSGQVGVAFTGGGMAVTGSLSGVHAAPFITNSNGALFGDNTINGPDSTQYVTTGTGSITFTFSASEKYFGLLWGSVDTYNTLEFFDSTNKSLGTITGTDVNSMANGDQGPGGSIYVNINSSIAFTKVVASATSNAFEIDNVAYSATVLSPEPSTIVAAVSALPIGLAWAWRRRKRSGVEPA